MARHHHNSQYVQLVSTFALLAFGFLTIVSAKYQQKVVAAVSEVRTSRSAVVRNLTVYDVRKSAAANRADSVKAAEGNQTMSRAFSAARARSKASGGNVSTRAARVRK